MQPREDKPIENRQPISTLSWMVSKFWENGKKAISFVWRNPGKVIAAGILVLGGAKIKRGIFSSQAVNLQPSGDAANPPPICQASYQSTAFLLREFCPNNILYSQQVMSIIGHQDFIFTNPSQMEHMKGEMKVVHDAVMATAQDRDSAEKTIRAINTKDFQIKVTSGFPETNEAELYSRYLPENNTLLTLPPARRRICDRNDDLILSMRSTFNTIDLMSSRTYGDPSSIDLSRSAQIEPDSPFTTEAEFNELRAAVDKGEIFIIMTFADLHKNAAAGRLSKAQRKDYENLIKPLEDYTPRCHTWIADGYSVDQSKAWLDANGNRARPRENTPYFLFVAGLKPCQDGTAVSAYSIPNPKDKVSAYIADTFIRRSDRTTLEREFYMGIMHFSPNKAKKAVISAADSDIHADPLEIRRTFYPEVVKYREQFVLRHKKRKPHEEEHIQQEKPRSQRPMRGR